MLEEREASRGERWDRPIGRRNCAGDHGCGGGRRSSGGVRLRGSEGRGSVLDGLRAHHEDDGVVVGAGGGTAATGKRDFAKNPLFI